MGVGHLLFILVNMAVPYWIWVKKSDSPQVEWTNFNKNLTRIIDAKKGFENCPTPTVVDAVRDLCVQSASQFNEKSLPVARAGEDLIFICEVDENVATVTFQKLPHDASAIDAHADSIMRNSGGEKLSCRAGGRVQSSPAFMFNMSGWLTHIYFHASGGSRQRVPVQSCRFKLKRAEELNPQPLTREELLMKLPRAEGDPEDVLGANQACLEYDVAARWKSLRRKYER